MRTWLGLALLLACAPLSAGEIVFYRCTDASGALMVQNMPCPKGMQQTTRVMQAVAAPPPAPAPPRMPETPPAAMPPQLFEAPQATASASMPAAEAAPAPRPEPVPLPPLFQCTPRGGDAYLSETDQPPSRCVALRVTGLDGNPQTGAGEACEVLRDTCTAVPEAQHCAMWRKRVLDAESAWHFSTPAQADEPKREYERLSALYEASDCAAQKP